MPVATYAAPLLILTATALPGCDGADRLPADGRESAVTDQYTGSADCRECHESFYELWAPSFHGLAMQPWSADLAAARLTSHEDEIEIGEYRYQADIGGGGVIERGPGGEKTLPIAHVLGGKNVYYFLTPTDRGRLQTLPLAYDVQHSEWFDTAASGVRHSPHHPDEPLHWTDREYTFNTSCHGCHVSQFAANYDLSADTYDTVWAEPGINCETCHGSGAEHVRICREAAGGEPPEDLKVISTTVFDVDQTNAMCAPCHARMVPITAGFIPGERYFDHYDLACLENFDFHPDGRDLGENYTFTSWRLSPCVESGQLDCLHCHTSSGRYRFQEENVNGACLPCHSARVANVEEHSRHGLGTAGGRCVDCHMPKTEFARMWRSDHSMLPPTPAATLAFESPNACNLCHDDRDAEWADALVREWHADDYQAPVLERAALIDAARKGDWSKLPAILAYLGDPEHEEVFATALIRLLRNCDDERKWSAIIAALKDASPLVRAAAAEALEGHMTAEAVLPLLDATRDEFRLVRLRAAATLAPVPMEVLKEQDRADVASARAELEESWKARPDDHTSHYNLGNLYLEGGDLDRALELYETATRLQPRDVAPLVNGAMALSQLGRQEEAVENLRRAIEIEPESVPANLNLGMLLGELGRVDEAETSFRAVLAIDPESAVAAFNLGVILASSRPQEALELCRQAVERAPNEPRYGYAYAFYLSEGGRKAEAIDVLRRQVNNHPGHADSYMLLGDLLVKEKRKTEAVELYTRAANEERLPQRMRQHCAGLAGQLQRDE